MQREAHKIIKAEPQQKRKLVKLMFALQEHSAGSATDRGYIKEKKKAIKMMVPNLKEQGQNYFCSKILERIKWEQTNSKKQQQTDKTEL